MNTGKALSAEELDTFRDCNPAGVHFRPDFIARWIATVDAANERADSAERDAKDAEASRKYWFDAAGVENARAEAAHSQLAAMAANAKVLSEWIISEQQHGEGAHEPGCEVCEAIVALSTLPAAPAVTSGWRDISTAPKDGRFILIAAKDMYGDKDKGGAHWSVNKGWWEADKQRWITGMSSHYPPLYWQPLPAPPSPSPVEKVNNG